MANEIAKQDLAGRQGQHLRESDVAILGRQLRTSLESADVIAAAA